MTDPNLLALRDTILAKDFDAPMTAREWNAIYSSGTPVTYEPVLPQMVGIDPVHTQTRSQAWELSDGTPVVKIEGRTGGIALTHLVIRNPD